MDVEICCGDVESLGAALEGGATRVELCSGLTDGGLTPANSLVTAAVVAKVPEINVLIRPRSGDFLYSDLESSAMRNDVIEVVASGATGIVIGALTADGNVDKDCCETLIRFGRAMAKQRNQKLNVTFHRAFDLCRDWRRALDDIVDLGCDCLLTSGLADTAEDGVDTLREMVIYAAGRIKIMAGAGVNPLNVRKICGTGVDLVHSTARTVISSSMRFRRDGVSMGYIDANEYVRMQTSAETVAELLYIVKNYDS